MKPVVLRIKALYRHPDAGGLWEAHLKRVLHNLGGAEVIEFPGNFYFPESKLLLSTCRRPNSSGPGRPTSAFLGEVDITS